MKLYSVQPLSVWNELSQEKIVTAQPFYEKDGEDASDQSWKTAYKWLSQQMNDRGISALENQPIPECPMWAWYWYNGHRNRRPDLRHTTMRNWAQTRRMVMLTLDVDDARVQLSDYDGWHACLNYWYLARARQTTAFQREVKRVLNTSYYRTKPLPDEAYHARLVESWNSIFNLDDMRSILASPKKNQMVQATLWHLSKKDVKNARLFGMNRASQAVDFLTHPHLLDSQ